MNLNRWFGAFVHTATLVTHAQLRYLVLLETGFSKILLNMNAFSLLPLILASISKLVVTWLFQQMDTVGTANRLRQGSCSYLQQ